MHAPNLEPDPAAGPVSTAVGVTIVAAEGTTAPESLVAALRREVVDGHLEVLDVLLAQPEASTAVVLLWIPVAAAAAASPLARIIRWADHKQPRPGLIGWSVNGATADAESALAAGFDDFVAGACSTREMAARIRAVHRRVHWNGQRRTGVIRRGAMTLDTDDHELRIDGQTFALTTTELRLVLALVRARGRTLTRAELLDHAWGSSNFDIGERAVDNVVLRLRRKLGKADLIQTVRGVGFRIDA